MDYKFLKDTIYARFDKGDEIISGIVDICQKEKILSATFSGIGGCGEVTVATLNPETNVFLPHTKTGLSEMISLNGSISADDNDNIEYHAHAMFSYLGEDGSLKFLGGHLKKAVIMYTGEIVINPVQEGIIRRMKDPYTGITVWKL